MATPLFPSDGQGERTDALVRDDNSVGFKRGVGSKTPTGGSQTTSNAAVATHTANGTFGAGDPFVVIGGESTGGLAVPLAVDPGGGELRGVYAQAPINLSFTSTTGTLTAATYYYRVTATTSSGETTPCAEASFALAATGGIVLSWQQSPGATGYKVYGRTTGAELLIASVTPGTLTTYTDSGSISPSGAMPTTNTAFISLGAVTTTPQSSSTASITSVSGSVSSVSLLAANSSRKGATFFNDSTAILYLSLGTTSASTTSYTLQVGPNGYYELPFAWQGAIQGIWGSATGAVRITELT